MVAPARVERATNGLETAAHPSELRATPGGNSFAQNANTQHWRPVYEKTSTNARQRDHTCILTRGVPGLATDYKRSLREGSRLAPRYLRCSTTRIRSAYPDRPNRFAFEPASTTPPRSREPRSFPSQLRVPCAVPLTRVRGIVMKKRYLRFGAFAALVRYRRRVGGHRRRCGTTELRRSRSSSSWIQRPRRPTRRRFDRACT